MTLTRDQLDHWAEQVRISNPLLPRQIAECVPEGGLFIDVGANVGVITEEVLKQRGCDAILFEPVPEFHSYCLEKLGHKATVEGYALGDESGKAILYLGFVSGNFGWNTLIQEKTTSDMSPLEVQVLSLDEYLESHPVERLDAIKIDTEGYEYKVLRGMQKTLLRFHPMIFLEIGWGISHPDWQEEVGVFEWLFANGYERFDYNVSATTDVVIVPARPA